MKNILRVTALVLVIVFVLSFAACKKGPEYSVELVQGKLQDVVNIIQRNGHLHTDDYVAGMTEDEFEPVYDAIYEVVENQSDIEYKLISESTDEDDDGNLFYILKYEIKANGNGVTVEVKYGDRQNSLYSIELK